MKRFFVIVCVTTLAALASAVASADQFMKINFNNDAYGSSPTTGPGSPLPVTTVQSIGGYDPDPDPNNGNQESPPTAADGTIQVQDVLGLHKAAVMTTNASDNQLGALWMDTGFSAGPSSQVGLKFDLNILAAQTTGVVQPKFLNNTSDTAGILFGLNTFTSNGPAFLFAAAQTSATGGVFALRSPDNNSLTTFGSYVNGLTYDITLNADYATGTADAYINGVLAMSGIPFWTSGDASVTTDEFFMHLNGDTDNFSNQVAIDNIQAFTGPVPVPEPNRLIGLLGLGGMGLVGLVWRRKRAA